MLTEEQLNAILAQRGYRRIPSPEPHMWRSWLWVEPVNRPDGIPTKLCQWASNLKEDGLHFLLDHYCELQSAYYTNEDRANNRRSALKREDKTMQELTEQIAVELCHQPYYVVAGSGDVVVIVEEPEERRTEVHNLNEWKALREKIVSTVDMLDAYAEYRMHNDTLAQEMLKALAYRGISKDRADAATVVHPEMCDCDECASLRYAYYGEE